MKYLFLICLIGLVSCGDTPGTDVFIENQKSSNDITISGKIQNGAGMEIFLEAPLLESRGTKVQVAKP